MGFADRYLSKQKGFKAYIAIPPSGRLRFIVVIPVYCETNLLSTLESLWNCQKPSQDAEVILVINVPSDADEAIKKINNTTISETQEWIRDHNDPSLRFFIVDRHDLPPRDAGAGLARKIGMDEAVYRFSQVDNPGGYILSFDADSRCDSTYFTAIEHAVETNPRLQGFDIYFEHPLEGTEYSQATYIAITEYELHLRVVNQFMRYTGFHYDHHTVGSCFGVRADMYASQGGMNKRKGGEDFYFLHKVIPLGHFADITTTRVIPSPRESFRVPFGTGPAITRRIAEGSEMTTYSPESFMALKQLFTVTPEFFRMPVDELVTRIKDLPVAMVEFLNFNDFVASVAEINANTGTPETFTSRFFRWFDAFRMVKFLNFAAREHFPKVKVSAAAGELIKLMGYPHPPSDTLELLRAFRKIETNRLADQ